MFQLTSSVLGTTGSLDNFCHALRPQQDLQTTEDDDFGFDPPRERLPVELEQSCTPPQDQELYPYKQDASAIHAKELDRTSQQEFCNAATAVAWSGQFTPPRSTSTTSTVLVDTKLFEHRRRASKVDLPDGGRLATTVSRQRRNACKRSTVSLTNPEEDEKRKQSLERNRLAATKSRIHKKKRIEQLRRDSSDKAVHNAHLKDHLLRMKEEVHQMNAFLSTHVSCDGCKFPEDTQRHLSHLGHESYAQQVASTAQLTYPAYPVNFTRYEPGYAMQLNYFSPGGQRDWSNPPLPGCNRESSFDTTILMHTDGMIGPP